jgi:hypothetical protein
MTTRNVALAEVIGVLVAAGSLVAAPVAKADLPPTWECEPGCWGAIAASHSTGQVEIRVNYKRRENAEEAAVLWCNVLGKTNDCQLVTSAPDGCLSLAGSSDGKMFAGRVAPTLDAADAAALDAAGPGSKIDLHDCNDYNGPRGTPS